MRSPKLVLAACAAAALVPASAAAQTPFDAPVKMTPTTGFGGYEPGVAVDRFGNIFVTAHKQNHGLVLSPDTQSAPGARSMSWVWWSKDGGKTFGGPPGLTPLMEQTLEFGDEGDLATDDADHLYFVDTNVTDVTFTRWKANALGNLTLEATRPLLPAGEPVDDRPWIAAHGNGNVIYIGNEGNTNTYTLGQVGGEANGPGRYTVYRSTNAGDMFDSIGYTLKDSGWCRPAWDRVRNDHRFVVFCTAQTAGATRTNLYSFVSTDDGLTWTRHVAGTFNAKDPIGGTTWPSATIGPDGTVYALVDDHVTNSSGAITATALTLFKSTDGGLSWTSRVLAAPKLTQYAWMDIAPDGSLGVAYYGRERTADAWHLYAGTAPTAADAPGMTDLGAVASAANTSPFGDFFQVQFGPDSKLNVVWTFENTDLLVEGLNTDIYYARQH